MAVIQARSGTHPTVYPGLIKDWKLGRDGRTALANS